LYIQPSSKHKPHFLISTIGTSPSLANGLASQTKKAQYVNTSDSDIASAFLTDAGQDVVVTWKPLVSQITKAKGISSNFDSSKIPAEA
jgi:NitT/TauT family transport system substrate-binding protein